MQIYRVPDERRYWAVRAESGKYFDHFTTHGVIALAHLNLLELEDTTEKSPPLDWKTLRGNFLRHKEVLKNTKNKTSSHLAQVQSFLYEMKVGDWVVTIGHGALRFGRIIGKPFIKKDPLTIVYDRQTGRKVDMYMDLRRQVEWGPSIARRDLPYGLLLSLKANQTLFCLDARWEAIYHSLYAAFLRDDKLYLSAKITTEDDIKNHSVSTIFKLLDEIEVIGKEFARTGKIDDFENVFSEYIDQDQLSITTKAQFHSPGEIWNAVTATVGQVNIDHWITYTVTAYSMLFGNKKMGFDGLVDLDTRKKIWDLVIERIKKNRAEKVVDSLQLELPKIDTSKLEDSSKDKTQ